MEQTEPSTTSQAVASQTATQEHEKETTNQEDGELVQKTTSATFCPNWNCMNPDCQLRHPEPQQPQHQPINGFRPPYPMNPYFFPQTTNFFYQTKHCKYGTQCHNPSCKFYHEQGTEQEANTSSNPEQVRHINGNHTESEVIQNEENTQHLSNASTNHVPHQNGGYSSPVPSPCKFGSQCRHPTCRFMHPFLVFQNPGYPVPTSSPYPYPMYNSPILCRYGKFCNNPMCQFNHLDREVKPEDPNSFANPVNVHMNPHLNANNGIVPNHAGNNNTNANGSDVEGQKEEANGEKTRTNGAWNVLQKNTSTTGANQEGVEDSQSDWPLPSTAANMNGENPVAKKNCKYGLNCRNITNSKCKYSHPNGVTPFVPFGEREALNGGVNPNHNFANRNRYHPQNNFMHNGNFRNPGPPMMRNPNGNGIRRPGMFNGGINSTIKCRYGLKCRNKEAGCKFSHDGTENGVNGEVVNGGASQQQQSVDGKTEANEASAGTAQPNVSEVVAS
eukprot:TRINITY_DN18948_c0_g1_i1.p1 TRINITY_DN18948_c0_g1~~TRINITY_DN18948_c0_g1_i1.p1  ORF type:complete len:501 (+),score=111.14 TRINITY_DN18948_c0_g1_i1:77-1579(+)